MRFLGFGTYDLDKHPRIGIVLDGLTAHGDEVVAVNEPLGITTRERVAMLGRPWLAYRLVFRILRRWTTLARRARQATRAGAFDAILVGYLGQFDVILARLLFPRQTIVLDMLVFGADTARDRGVEGGIRLKLLGLLDRVSIRCASLVMVDTDEAVTLMPPKAVQKAVVVPVGAADSWFAVEPKRAPDSTRLRAVFFGLYTPLQGAPVIGQAIADLRDRPDVELTMIGNGQDYDATRTAAGDNPNVTWVDWVDAVDLPGIVAAHDVCLGIFSHRPKAVRVVPNKVYEGAALGCAIVTSDTPPQRRAFGDAAVYVPAENGPALAQALVALRDDPERLEQLRTAARKRAEQDFSGASIVMPLRSRLGR